MHSSRMRTARSSTVTGVVSMTETPTWTETPPRTETLWTETPQTETERF